MAKRKKKKTPEELEKLALYEENLPKMMAAMADNEADLLRLATVFEKNCAADRDAWLLLAALTLIDALLKLTKHHASVVLMHVEDEP